MKKRILLIYTNYASFVETDYLILSDKFEVIKYQYKPVKGLYNNSIEFIKQFYFLFIHIRKFHAFYIWFGDYHSFLPVLFAKLSNKKSFVVIGGYDVANLPELNYGSFTRPLRRVLTTFSFRHATLCIPVVEGLNEKLQKICPKAKSEIIHTGYNFQLNHPIEFEAQREKIILTVSITGNYQRYMVKGLDRFRELAEQLPEYKFYIIGVQENAKKLFNPLPSNLYLIPPVQQEELMEYYIRASYYAQFSRSEGLPNALCEAMLYGCIPLGINVGGISTAIGKYGLVTNNWNLEDLTDFIKQQNSVEREDVSQSIINRFDIEYRKDKLLALFS